MLLRQQQQIAVATATEEGGKHGERWELIVSDDVERLEEELIEQFLSMEMHDISLRDDENAQLKRVLSSCIKFANSGTTFPSVIGIVKIFSIFSFNIPKQSNTSNLQNS